MDRFVYRKISFPELCRLESDLEKLSKRQVLELCSADLGNDLERSLIGFGFLGTRYMKYLGHADVNKIFQVFIPRIQQELQERVSLFTDIVSLITLTMVNASQVIGFPACQAGYKDLYGAICSLIPDSLRIVVQTGDHRDGSRETEAALKLLKAFLTYVRSRYFLIQKNPLERHLFEEVLVAILNISQVLLHMELTILNETLKTFFELITIHKWTADGLGTTISSNKDFLEYVRQFLQMTRESRSLDNYEADYKKILLFYSAALKLYNIAKRPNVLLEARPIELMILFPEFKKASETLSDVKQKDKILTLRRLHLQLTSLIPLVELIAALKEIPRDAAFEFCLIFLDQFKEHQRLLDLHGEEVFSFMFQAMEENVLVSCPTEFNEITASVVRIITDVTTSNPVLFLKLIRIFTELTLTGKSLVHPGTRFIYLIQDTSLLFLNSQALFEAFLFYIELIERIPPSPNSPAVPVFLRLARTCYTFMPGKYQTRVRQKLPKNILEFIVPIDKPRTTFVAVEFISQIDNFLKAPGENFQELQSTMLVFSKSNHLPRPATLQKLNLKLDALWKYLVATRHNWARFQWMAPFLSHLIRVCANTQLKTLSTHLQQIVQMKLPKSTITIILLTLLSVSKRTDLSELFVEECIRKCHYQQVKGYLYYVYQQDPSRFEVLRKLQGELERSHTAGTATFPHNCCERTCCFVLANECDKDVSQYKKSHSSIECNLMHAVEELRKRKADKCQLSSVELQKLQKVEKQLRELLEDLR